MAGIERSHQVSLTDENTDQGPKARGEGEARPRPVPDPELGTPPSNTGVNSGKWCESGATMAPWPQISDSLLSSIPSPAPTATGLESALIPSSVSPWTPISEALAPPQTPLLPSSLWPLHHSRKSPQPSEWPTYAVSLQGPFMVLPNPDPFILAQRRRLSSEKTLSIGLPSGRPQTPAPDPQRGAA